MSVCDDFKLRSESSHPDHFPKTPDQPHMFFTYILWSESLGKFYVGQTQDLDSRVSFHNRGHVKFSSAGVPWVLVHAESHASRKAAVSREREIKGWKSSEAIRRLIEGQIR
ncbi:MAG: GIY-YIG nuclease family protein [Fimbriimonadaceae bacterium]